MRHAIIKLEGTSPAWVAADLPVGWRIVPGTLHDLAVLIEGPDDAATPPNAHSIDPTTAALLKPSKEH